MTHKFSGVNNVLFDLDGTLIDSSGTITACIDYALNQVGIPPVRDAPIRTLIGAPLLEIFGNEFGMSEEQTETAIVCYREHFDSLGQADTQIYANIQDVLSDLRHAGYRLFIATVKPTSIAEKVLDDLLLRTYFDGVAGSSMNHERRDKGSIIAHALDKFELDPMQSMMVGDRSQDISGARDNGLLAVAVTYGFGTREELHAAEPDHIVEHSRGITSLLLQ